MFLHECVRACPGGVEVLRRPPHVAGKRGGFRGASDGGTVGRLLLLLPSSSSSAEGSRLGCVVERVRGRSIGEGSSAPRFARGVEAGRGAGLRCPPLWPSQRACACACLSSVCVFVSVFLRPRVCAPPTRACVCRRFMRRCVCSWTRLRARVSTFVSRSGPRGRLLPVLSCELRGVRFG